LDTPSSRGWRLLDFADLSDADFVREAHRVLLGRGPSLSEANRRLHELRESSRMEVVVRLALSPEGRRALRPGIRGPGLSVLSRAARAIEAAYANPKLARAVRSSERVARAALFGRSSRRRSMSRLARVAAVAVLAVEADRRLRRAPASLGGNTRRGRTP
jgi:hypothetical protein